MALQRVATWKRAEQGKAVLLVVDGKRIEINHASLTTLDTAEKIEAELQSQATTSNVQLPKIFVHVNRDGSVAVATGAEPRAWPEDEPK
jgi:N-dimethylarginine dimethylaminohydrolase